MYKNRQKKLYFFFQKADLDKKKIFKMENYKLIKLLKDFKTIYKNGL